jgi:hypothetical protein
MHSSLKRDMLELANPHRRGNGTTNKLGSDEALVVDARAKLSPAEMVERKLMELLNGRPLLLSQMRLADRSRDRGRVRTGS